MPKQKRRWNLTQHAKNVHQLRVELPSRKDSLKLLLVSDVHWDNPDCKRALLKQHFDQAVAEDCPILSLGDFFCAMQGKYDRRSDKSKVRPEHQSGDYLDKLVDTAADWLEPYKNHLALLGKGNHETKLRERHETCILDRLASKLRDKGGITQLGGYAGWLRILANRLSSSFSVRLWYHHGFGGGGPVTQGKIDFNRYGSYIDTDIIACGHVHWKEAFPIMRCYLNGSNTQKVRQVWCIRCGTYKDEFLKSDAGFHIEKGQGPRPLGGWWVHITQVKDNGFNLSVYSAD